jgi:hypothetical protein
MEFSVLKRKCGCSWLFNACKRASTGCACSCEVRNSRSVGLDSIRNCHRNLLVRSFTLCFDSRLAFKVLTHNRGASLSALDDEYRLVVNDISFTDLL